MIVLSFIIPYYNAEKTIIGTLNSIYSTKIGTDCFEVIIIDLFGRQVMSTTLHEGRVELDLDGVAKGVYVARITGVGGSTTIKLVKE